MFALLGQIKQRVDFQIQFALMMNLVTASIAASVDAKTISAVQAAQQDAINFQSLTLNVMGATFVAETLHLNAFQMDSHVT